MRCARTLAIPVVGPAWLVESAAAGGLLPVEAYLWQPSCDPAPWKSPDDKVGAAEATPRSHPSAPEPPPPPPQQQPQPPQPPLEVHSAAEASAEAPAPQAEPTPQVERHQARQALCAALSAAAVAAHTRKGATAVADAAEAVQVLLPGRRSQPCTPPRTTASARARSRAAPHSSGGGEVSRSLRADLRDLRALESARQRSSSPDPSRGPSPGPSSGPSPAAARAGGTPQQQKVVQPQRAQRQPPPPPPPPPRARPQQASGYEARPERPPSPAPLCSQWRQRTWDRPRVTVAAMAERVAAETSRTERSVRLHAREQAARRERDAARLARESRLRATTATTATATTATAAATTATTAATTATAAAAASSIGASPSTLMRRTAKAELFASKAAEQLCSRQQPSMWGARSMPVTHASAPALCCSAPAIFAPTLLAPPLSGTNAAWPSPALQQAQGHAVDALQGSRLGACVATPVPSPLRSWLNQAAHEVAMREVATREFALPH
jgi:hypothetical protein